MISAKEICNLLEQSEKLKMAKFKLDKLNDDARKAIKLSDEMKVEVD